MINRKLRSDTAGFLVRTNAHLFKTHTSKSAIIRDEDGNEFFPGDQLSAQERRHIQGGMFHGFDFDSTMLRIAAMNLMLKAPQRRVQALRGRLHRHPGFSQGRRNHPGSSSTTWRTTAFPWTTSATPSPAASSTT